jgi:glycosidase
MLINYRNEMLHDSTLGAFRDPVGALPAGAPLTLRFQTRLAHVESVYLCLFSETFHEDHLMRRTDHTWQVDLAAPSMPDVYWYYFAVNVGGRLCYYGASGNRSGGSGCVYSDPPPAYQLTVYQQGFDVPAWFQKSVMYQIFPDRFRPSDDDTAQKGMAYHRAKGRRVFEHKTWNEQPLYKPLPGEAAYDPCDYFGGTLKGIEASLDYLQSLGIGVLYLNPIFEAASNHRYNTADYLRIDPMLGDEADFLSLCKEAAKRGIRILLDGVFSHTGSDSLYFNREGAYESVGAANSPDSVYYPWYTFVRYPDKYKCWWGFETLPEINEDNPDWQQFAITSEDSVIRHWLTAGAKGYRLDVADELPDEVLAKMYAAAKKTQPESVLLGEVWEDATTKLSYGARRRYALGGMLDSVTNYPLRASIISFLTGKSQAFDLKYFLVDQAANYPRPLYYALTNLLSSHDVERIRTALSTRIDPHELSRSQQATFVITDRQNQKGAKLQRLAAILQYALPGVPCLYYGDEKGMTGFLDPFNRAPFAEALYDLTCDYQRLAQLRQSADALQTGHAVFFAPDADCLGVLRYVMDGRDALWRPAQNGIYFVAINRSDALRLVVFDFQSRHPLFSEAHQKALRFGLRGMATCQLTGKCYPLVEGLLEMELAGLSAVWLKID